MFVGYHYKHLEYKDRLEVNSLFVDEIGAASRVSSAWRFTSKRDHDAAFWNTVYIEEGVTPREPTNGMVGVQLQ